MDVQDEAAALARGIFALRRLRARHLPAELLADVAWLMLLALYVAEADGEAITARDVIRIAEVPVAVGQRWFALFAAEGFVAGGGDLDDVASLTPRGSAAIAACLVDAQQHLRAGRRGRAEG